MGYFRRSTVAHVCCFCCLVFLVVRYCWVWIPRLSSGLEGCLACRQLRLGDLFVGFETVHYYQCIHWYFCFSTVRCRRGSRKILNIEEQCRIQSECLFLVWWWQMQCRLHWDSPPCGYLLMVVCSCPIPNQLGWLLWRRYWEQGVRIRFEGVPVPVFERVLRPS